MRGIFAIATLPDVDCEIVDEDDSPMPMTRQYLPAVVAPRAEAEFVPYGSPAVAEVATLGTISAEQAMPYVVGAIGVIASGAILWWGTRPVRKNSRRSRRRR